MKITTWIILLICSVSIYAQTDSSSEKKRLDFAKMYFEAGGTYFPSFQGTYQGSTDLVNFDNPASISQYLTWGGFHFWGHGEFYVSIPLAHYPLSENENTSSTLVHSVATGFRYFPWVYREKKLIPYIGLNWSALDFQQIAGGLDNSPFLSKNFILSPDAGLLYGYKKLAIRVGVNYFKNTTWDYPISKEVKAEITTPHLGVQVGILYAWDSTKKTTAENVKNWNEFPTLSKQSLGSNTFGNVYVGFGPSISFSLTESKYNQSKLPYLQDKLTSSNYFDMAIGYNFNQLGLFASLSYRNPTFKTEGYGTVQEIQKKSLLLEVNKFLLDYSGFTPYLGLSIGYDRLVYAETIEESGTSTTFDPTLEPGLTFGWDIQPGKNQEALILRTNLRWFPFSSFDVDGITFDFPQLEYNLIQVLFYPGRYQRNKRRG